MEPSLYEALCYASADCYSFVSIQLKSDCYGHVLHLPPKTVSGYFILLCPTGVVKGSLLQNMYQIMANNCLSKETNITRSLQKRETKIY